LKIVVFSHIAQLSMIQHHIAHLRCIFKNRSNPTLFMHNFQWQDTILHTSIFFNNLILKLLLGIYIMTFYYSIYCKGHLGQISMRSGQKLTFVKWNVIKQLQHFTECDMMFHGTPKMYIVFKCSIKHQITLNELLKFPKNWILNIIWNWWISS